MSDDSEGEYIALDDVPEDAAILLCGSVVTDEEGEIGKIDTDQFGV